ncbi:unnamed protein product, partial [Protopolystoma xenopodis]
MISVFHAADFILTKLLHFWKRWHAQAGNFWRASGLGFAFAIGAYLVFCSNVFLSESKVLWCFGLYVCVISFFHWSEFFFASLFYSKTASIDLYMLNHSPEYLAAAACSIFEHWVGSFIRYFFLTNYCAPAWLNLLGLFICIGGETLRKAAIITASTNFNHHVQFYKRQDHELVTYGVYSCFRHPAYVGWFYWSLGTQILLANPICTIAYPIAAYRFFDERIFIEEASLAVTLHTDLGDLKLELFCMQAALACEVSVSPSSLRLVMQHFDSSPGGPLRSAVYWPKGNRGGGALLVELQSEERLTNLLANPSLSGLPTLYLPHRGTPFPPVRCLSDPSIWSGAKFKQSGNASVPDGLDLHELHQITTAQKEFP